MTCHSWWRPRYLCDRCEATLGRRRRLTALLIIFTAVAGVIIARYSPPPTIRSSRPVSALDATPRQKPNYNFEEEEKDERVFCGAITRRGTRCRRLVRPGERCSQHRR